MDKPLIPTYNHNEIESKWNLKWEELGIYKTSILNAKKPYYNLMMYPYPSAEGLHVGNVYAFVGSDIHGRYKRMQGYDVFEPMGFDSGGIHSENFAIKMGVHPRIMTEKNIANFTKQLQKIGNMFDWDHSVDAMDPAYYKWTQWIFTQMFKAGLAYKKDSSVTWCPGCKTTVSDEQTEKVTGKKYQVPSTENQEESIKYQENGTKYQVPSIKNKEIINIGKLGTRNLELGTEEITVCERCKTPIERKQMKQWFFRITDYAQRLLDNTKTLNWSKKVLATQVNWIGRSEGINITYKVADKTAEIVCFTTRPDTNFGATFIVLAPEHPIISQITAPSEKNKVDLYIQKSLSKTELERIAEGTKKTGVFTGAYAINNLNGRKLPIWISDFVLGNVGTGAVVGVPAHDIRDFQFAQTFNIPITRVVVGKDGDTSEITRVEQVQEEQGEMINSQFLDGMDIHEATKAMMDHLEEKGWGKRQVHYKLRDWNISRQRYWGPPIPMIYCESCAKEGKSWFDTEDAGKYQVPSTEIQEESTKCQVPCTKIQDMSVKEKLGTRHMELGTSLWTHGWSPVPDDQLPVKLPDIDDYLPDGSGKAPLARHPEFYETKCPVCGGKAERETDVSDTFMDSSWYFLRYPSTAGASGTDADVDTQVATKSPFDTEITKKWLPVSQYCGGAEHSVLHLMYSRFVTMALHDLGFLDFNEPFPNFYAHGLLIKDGAKMSKSKGNVINPDAYIAQYGSDVLRMYLSFMGPYAEGGDFRDSGIAGMQRFVNRIWKNFQVWQGLDIQDDLIYSKLDHALHQTISKVTRGIDMFKYNTSIAALMEFMNSLEETSPSFVSVQNQEKRLSHLLEKTLLLLAPFAPHISEDLWQLYSEPASTNPSIHQQPWPILDENKLLTDMVTIAIQINGKLRGTLELETAKASDKSLVLEKVKQLESLEKYLIGTIVKEIFVPGRLVNLVVK